MSCRSPRTVPMIARASGWMPAPTRTGSRRAIDSRMARAATSISGTKMRLAWKSSPTASIASVIASRMACGEIPSAIAAVVSATAPSRLPTSMASLSAARSAICQTPDPWPGLGHPITLPKLLPAAGVTSLDPSMAGRRGPAVGTNGPVATVARSRRGAGLARRATFSDDPGAGISCHLALPNPGVWSDTVAASSDIRVVRGLAPYPEGAIEPGPGSGLDHSGSRCRRAPGDPATRHPRGIAMDAPHVIALWLHTIGFVIAWGYYGVLARVVVPALERSLELSKQASTLVAIERRATPVHRPDPCPVHGLRHVPAPRRPAVRRSR